MAAAAAAHLLSRSAGGGALLLTSAFGRRRSCSLAYSRDLGLRRLHQGHDHHHLALLFPSSSSTPRSTGGRRSHHLPCAAHESVETVGCAGVVSAVEDDENAPPPPAAAAAPSPSSDPVREAAGALDIRVGRVLRAWRHPEADSLYVEEVDVGEAEPRTICSGLVGYVALDHLQDARVVVLANLKPRNMRGVKSNGMLMAASDASHETVELLVPPDGAAPGERIWFGSEEEKDGQPDAATPNQVQKKKIWESVQPHLKTTDSCIAVLGVHPMQTSAGVVVCESLKNARIS